MRNRYRVTRDVTVFDLTVRAGTVVTWWGTDPVTGLALVDYPDHVGWTSVPVPVDALTRSP